MLAFNFASRTFAYLRLAQGLSRSLSAFSSFMREYLDKVIKVDHKSPVRRSANDADHLIANLRATFNCIQEAGLELTMHKVIWVPQKMISSAEQSPHKASNPKGKMFKTSWEKPNSQSRKKFYRDIWAS